MTYNDMRPSDVQDARMELVAQRLRDPGGEIAADRMERGFDVAEAMVCGQDEALILAGAR
jgi:hypothetical protein